MVSSSHFLFFSLLFWQPLDWNWNVLGCILVHMCSTHTHTHIHTIDAPRQGKSGVSVGCLRKLQVSAFRSLTNYYVCIVYNTYYMLLPAEAAAPGPVPSLAMSWPGQKGFDIKIWWHVVISAQWSCPPCCPCSSMQFDSIRCDALRCDAMPPVTSKAQKVNAQL